MDDTCGEQVQFWDRISSIIINIIITTSSLAVSVLSLQC